MYRILSILMALLLTFGIAFSEETVPLPETEEAAEAVEDAAEAIDINSIDLTVLSLDSLMRLRDQVNAEIEARGIATYFDLTRGDKGDDVANLQERLKELGYYDGQISGKYDAETQKAMKQFEKKNGLENNGDASREDQLVLFSSEALPKNDITPDAMPEETTRPEVTPASDESHEEYGDFDYTEVFRYPEEHTGEKVKLIGKVLQVMGDRKSGFQIRLATAGSSDVVYVMIPFDPGYNILEDDRLTIFGVITGTITYESIWNQSITIPSALADEIELR